MLTHLHMHLQSMILSYIPEARTLFLLELQSNVMKRIEVLEDELHSQKRKLSEYNETIYDSCSHIRYTSEKWDDYHKIQTRRRCDLCELYLKSGQGFEQSCIKYMY